MNGRNKPTARTLWIAVVLAFVILISGWSTLIYLAGKNRPAAIPLEPAPDATQATHTE